jgi:hypothetical protein
MIYPYIKAKGAAKGLINYIVQWGKDHPPHQTTFDGIADSLLDEYRIDSDATDLQKVLVYTSLFEVKPDFPPRDVEFEKELIRKVSDLIGHLDEQRADKELGVNDFIEFKKDVAYLRECIKLYNPM